MFDLYIPNIELTNASFPYWFQFSTNSKLCTVFQPIADNWCSWSVDSYEQHSFTVLNWKATFSVGVLIFLPWLDHIFLSMQLLLWHESNSPFDWDTLTIINWVLITFASIYPFFIALIIWNQGVWYFGCRCVTCIVLRRSILNVQIVERLLRLLMHL